MREVRNSEIPIGTTHADRGSAEAALTVVPVVKAPTGAHQDTGQTLRENLARVERQLVSANEERKQAIAELKRVSWILRYHSIRLWAARHGMPGWMYGFIAATVSSLIFAVVIILIGAGLPIVLSSVAIAYLVGVGGCFWLFLDSPLERRGNRLAVREGNEKLAKEQQNGALNLVAQKTQIVEKAKQLKQTLVEERNSEAHKHQVEKGQLLSIDPGRLYPDEFERYVAAIFHHLGFTVELTGHVGDQGVDVLAWKGTIRLAIQAKRYLSAVGNSAVQEVYAGMAFHRCHRCAVVTNAEFTQGAVALAQSTGCVLISGNEIAALIRGEIDFCGN